MRVLSGRARRLLAAAMNDPEVMQQIRLDPDQAVIDWGLNGQERERFLAAVRSLPAFSAARSQTRAALAASIQFEIDPTVLGTMTDDQLRELARGAIRLLSAVRMGESGASTRALQALSAMVPGLERLPEGSGPRSREVVAFAAALQAVLLERQRDELTELAGLLAESIAQGAGR